MPNPGTSLWATADTLCTSSPPCGEPWGSCVSWPDRRAHRTGGYGPAVIKLTFCLTRREGLSREEFQAYWRETHAPLVASVADTLRIRRYVQLHTFPADTQTATRASRDAPPEYDGVAELWWESWDDL